MTVSTFARTALCLLGGNWTIHLIEEYIDHAVLLFRRHLRIQRQNNRIATREFAARKVVH